MFRKTLANTTFQQGLKKLKDEARFKIGQAEGSSAIDKYIEV